MIIDSLKNTAQYEQISPLFKKAFEYIKTLDFANLEKGRTELDGDNLFVMVNESELKEKSLAKLEVHNSYADIQIPVSKAETFGWSSRTDLKNAVEPFDSKKDIQFFTETPNSYIAINPGDFAIFFPEDGHAPCVGEGKIIKIIVKVKIQS